MVFFAIYLGHLGESAGRSYYFVFQFHVPLFFFLAGCTENYNRESNILKNLFKNINALLIPAFLYAIASLIIYVIDHNVSFGETVSLLQIIGKGIIRNTFFASALWFLTCLFIVKVIFSILRKLKYKAVMILAGIGMYCIAEFIISPKPIVEPHWYYNVDSALYYINFYIIGFALFPLIEKLLQADSLLKKSIIIGTGTVTLIYSALLFFGIDILNFQVKLNFLPFIIPLERAYLIILFVILLSYGCRQFKFLADIGQNTLYLCGNEYIIKTLIPAGLSLFGLTVSFNSPLSAYIYTIILLIAADNVFVPMQKPVFAAIKDKMNRIFNLIA